MDAILVDLDLRRAGASGRLGIRTPEGLGAVIAGSQPLEDALIGYPLDGPAPDRLRVLPAGHPPPNPSALMSSQRMQEILHQLASESDLLIIDTRLRLL